MMMMNVQEHDEARLNFIPRLRLILFVSFCMRLLVFVPCSKSRFATSLMKRGVSCWNAPIQIGQGFDSPLATKARPCVMLFHKCLHVYPCLFILFFNFLFTSKNDNSLNNDPKFMILFLICSSSCPWFLVIFNMFVHG